MTLFIVPEYPVCLMETLSEYELFGELDTKDIFLAEAYAEVEKLCRGRIFKKDNNEDMNELFGTLSRYREAEIYAPSLDFLREIRDGKEENLMVRIVLYFLATDRNVTARLPYRLERLPDGRFSKKIKDLLDDLWEMGVSFADLKPTFETDETGKTAKSTGLITERIVEEYYRRGFRSIRIDAKTVITPLGSDRAREIGVQFIKE